MAENIPRLPLAFEKDHNIRLWFAKVLRRVYADNVFPWSIIDFTDSNITDIETRNHDDLQDISGGAAGDNHHLTQSQHDTLTDGSEADSLHVHERGKVVEDVVNKSSDYTITADDTHVIADTTGGDIEITLGASPGDGTIKRVTKKVLANTVTITTDGAETINEEADAKMYFANSSFPLQAISGGWRVI